MGERRRNLLEPAIAETKHRVHLKGNAFKRESVQSHRHTNRLDEAGYIHRDDGKTALKRDKTCTIPVLGSPTKDQLAPSVNTCGN